MTRPPNRPDDTAWIDRMLDDLAQDPVADVPDALMARILADAHDMLPAPGGAPVRTPWWRQLVDGVGGWGSVGGLVAAAATGLAVGLGGLDTVGIDALWLVEYDSFYEEQDVYGAFGWDIEEG